MKKYIPYFMLFISISLLYNAQLFAQKKGDFTESEQKMIKENIKKLFSSYQRFGKFTEGPAFGFSEVYANKFQELFDDDKVKIYNNLENTSSEGKYITLKEYVKEARIIYQSGFNRVYLQNPKYDIGKKVKSGNNRFPYQTTVKAFLSIEGRSLGELVVSEEEVNMTIIFSEDLQNFRFIEQKSTKNNESVANNEVPEVDTETDTEKGKNKTPKTKKSKSDSPRIKEPVRGQRTYFDLSFNPNLPSLFTSSKNGIDINDEYLENLSNIGSSLMGGAGINASVQYFLNEKIGVSAGVGFDYFSNKMSQSINTTYEENYQGLYAADNYKRKFTVSNFREVNHTVFAHIPLQVHYQNYNIGKKYKPRLELSAGVSFAVPVYKKTIAKGDFNSTNTYNDGLLEILSTDLATNPNQTIDATYTLTYNNEPKNDSEAFINEIHGLYGDSEPLEITLEEATNQSVNIFGLVSAGYSFYRPRKLWSYYMGLNFRVSVSDLFNGEANDADNKVPLLYQREQTDQTPEGNTNSGELYTDSPNIGSRGFDYNSIYNRKHTAFRILSPGIVISARYLLWDKEGRPATSRGRKQNPNRYKKDPKIN